MGRRFLIKFADLIYVKIHEWSEMMLKFDKNVVFDKVNR